MAEKTSLSLSMTAANGDKMTKAVTDVNPAADNSALNEFAQGLAALTTNTLNTVSKITKQELSGTYTPLTFTVDSNPNNSSIVPTKIDDTHYTIAAADLLDTSKGVWLYKDQGGEGGDLCWGVTRINFSPSQLLLNSYVVVNKTSIGFIWFAMSNSADSIELSVFADATSSANNFTGYEFDIVIPGGQKDSTTWDSYTINFKIV